jgi:hypothetical protein
MSKVFCRILDFLYCIQRLFDPSLPLVVVFKYESFFEFSLKNCVFYIFFHIVPCFLSIFLKRVSIFSNDFYELVSVSKLKSCPKLKVFDRHVQDKVVESIKFVNKKRNFEKITYCTIVYHHHPCLSPRRLFSKVFVFYVSFDDFETILSPVNNRKR